MALEPYRQRIGISDSAGGGVSQIVNVSSPDVGRMVASFGQSVLQAAEPYVREEAIEQGLRDFAADGLGKDENGNYIVPETPRGGRVYQASYDQAKFSQYAISTQNDFEMRLNDLSAEVRMRGGSPDEFSREAMNILEGVMAGTPTEIRGDVFETLTREVRQRDLALSNAYVRQEIQNIYNGHTASAGEFLDNAASAALTGTPEGVARAGTLAADAAELYRELEGMNLVPEGTADRMLRSVDSYTGLGAIMAEMNQFQDALTSDDFTQMANMLDGIAAEGSISIGGRTAAELLDAVPDGDVRSRGSTLFRRRASQLAQAERANAAANEAQFNLNMIPEGTGKPIGMSNSDYRDAVLTWYNQTGLDPNSAEGINQGVARFRDLPVGDLYKDQVTSFDRQTASQLNETYDLYRNLTNVMGPDGQPTDIITGTLNADEQAFWHHFDFAMQGGNNVTDARTIAKEMMDRDYGTVDEMTSMLRSVTRSEGMLWGEGDPGITNEELFDLMDDELGVDWADLDAGAQEFLITHAAQGVTRGVNPREAYRFAARSFQENMVQDPYAAASGMQMANGRPAAYVRKNEAVVPVIDISDPTGPGSTEYAERAVDLALREMGNTEAMTAFGVSATVDEMKLGENIFLQHTGRHHTERIGSGRGSRRVQSNTFAVMYFDPETGLPPTAVMNESGGPLVIDLGPTQRKQESFNRNWLRRRGEAQREVEQMRQTRTDTAGAIFGPEFAGMGGGPGDDAIAEAQARVDQEFAIGERIVGTDADDMNLTERQRQEGVGTTGIRRESITPRAEITTEDLMPPEAEQRIIRNRTQPASGDDRTAMLGLAQSAGIQPEELVAIAMYESAGTMNPAITGGDNNNYHGIFQFGANEREQYGVSTDQSIAEQVAALGRFLNDRGYRPGMGWRRLYTTINAGNPFASVSAADSNGSQLHHYREIQNLLPRARQWLARN